MDQDSKPPLDENARLMRKVDDDDIEAFKCLYQRYATILKQFFIIRGADNNSADDFVQKIFTSLWQQRKNYRVESSFEAYLYSAARNTLYQEIRQSHKKTGLSSKKKPVCDDGIYKTLSQPEAKLYFQELSEALETAKAKLTEKQLRALEASQIPEIDFDKISEELGCSKGAYKKRLKRARRRLRKHLASFFTDGERRKKS